MTRGSSRSCTSPSTRSSRRLRLRRSDRPSATAAPPGWRDLTDAIKESFPDVRYAPEYLIGLGDRWVVRLVMSGRGRASGVRTSQTWGSVYHVSSRGRIARQDVYLSWEEALAAAELAEDR